MSTGTPTASTATKNNPVHSAGWERSRHYQLVLARGSAVLILALLVFLLIILLGPVRSAVAERDKDEFAARVDLFSGDVHSALMRARQLAEQIPSRTLIRDELVAYLEGRRTLDWYVEFTQPKLGDAVRAAGEIRGVYRFGPAGEPLTGWELDAQAARAVPLDPARTRIVPGSDVDPDDLSLLVAARIEAPRYGLAGFDVVSISLRNLQRRLVAAAQRLNGASIRLVYTGGDAAPWVHTVGSVADPDLALNLPPPPPDAQEAIFVDRRIEGPRGDRRLVLYYAVATDWWFVVSQREAILLQGANSEAQRFLILVLVAGLAVVVANALVVRVLSQRTLLETGELARLVEERTAELQTVLAEKDLLMREVHHRIKNDMALVRSMLSLQAAQLGHHEAQESLRDAEGLLALMGRIYNYLYQSEDYGTVAVRPVIEGLLHDLGQGLRGKRVRSEAFVGDLVLPRKIAVPIGIMVNELMVNAYKYAAHQDRELQVRVTIRHVADHSERGTVHLGVSDDGAGFPAAVLGGSYGFGLSMIEALAGQYGGSVAVRNDPGATVVVTLPIPDTNETDDELG